MARQNDGLIMLLDKVEIGEKTVGYISEDGIDWGGAEAEYTEIFAAQQRSVPVKKVEKKGATNELTFKLIQLDPTNCATVMGGSAVGTSYTAPSSPVTIEQAFKITTGTGHTFSVEKAQISAKFRGKINGAETFGAEVKVTLLSPPKIDFA